MKRINRNFKVRNFHQAKWDEPIIFELSKKGERGILIPEAEEEVRELVGAGVSVVPVSIRGTSPIAEISQQECQTI